MGGLKKLVRVVFVSFASTSERLMAEVVTPAYLTLSSLETFCTIALPWRRETAASAR